MRPDKSQRKHLRQAHGDSACRGQKKTMLKRILTITPMIKYSKFEILIFNKEKMQIFNEEIDEISSGKRQNFLTSQVSYLRWGHNKVACVLHVFCSNFWLAHRTMLKLGCEVYDRGMGKIKLKKVVFVTFLTVFSAIFGSRQTRTLDLIEIID